MFCSASTRFTEDFPKELIQLKHISYLFGRHYYYTTFFAVVKRFHTDLIGNIYNKNIKRYNKYFYMNYAYYVVQTNC